MKTPGGSVLIIACGALAVDLVRIKRINDWSHIDVKCLPADLHNRPQLIAQSVQKKIEQYRNHYQKIFVTYGDCGTGGLLDNVLRKYDVERLPGAHCYEFFSGSDLFFTLQQTEIGTFYLTDFLVRHFERLVIKGLGIDNHPEFKQILFANYKKMLFLAQTDDDELDRLARAAADLLELKYERILTGDGRLTDELKQRIGKEKVMVDPPALQDSACAL